MTTDALFGYWVIAAVVLLFLLIFGGTWYRIRANRPPELYRQYDKLSAIDRQLRWGRLLAISLGLVVGLWATNSTATNHYQAILVAPSLWAAICLIGFTGLDSLVLGLTPAAAPVSPPRVRSCLPWKLLVVLVLVSGLLVASIRWAGRMSASDGRSHFNSWVLDGVFNWGRRQPFPGAFYTSLLTYCYPAVLLLAVVGAVAVWKRQAYLPSARYAALDLGFRRRTIRDLVLACLGAASSALAMMGLNIAWAYASLGPGSPERTVVVAASGVVGGIALGLSFWVIANLVFLPSVDEQLDSLAIPVTPIVTTLVEVIEPTLVEVEVEVLATEEPAAITAEPMSADALEDKVVQTIPTPETAAAEELAHEDAVAAPESGVVEEVARPQTPDATSEELPVGLSEEVARSTTVEEVAETPTGEAAPVEETVVVEETVAVEEAGPTQDSIEATAELPAEDGAQEVVTAEPDAHPTDEVPNEADETTVVQSDQAVTKPDQTDSVPSQALKLWSRIGQIFRPRPATDTADHATETVETGDTAETVDPAPDSTSTDPSTQLPMKVQLTNWIRRITTPATTTVPPEPSEYVPPELGESAPFEPSQSVPTEPIAQEPPPQAPPSTADPEPHQDAEATEPVPADDSAASDEPTSAEARPAKPAKDGKSGGFNRKRGSKKPKNSR